MPATPAPGVLTVTVETQWLPTFTVGVVTAGQAVGAVPALATKILKPKLTVQSGGVILGVIAPAGDPGRSKWPLALGAAALAGFFLVKLLR